MLSTSVSDNHVWQYIKYAKQNGKTWSHRGQSQSMSNKKTVP